MHPAERKRVLPAAAQPPVQKNRKEPKGQPIGNVRNEVTACLTNLFAHGLITALQQNEFLFQLLPTGSDLLTIDESECCKETLTAIAERIQSLGAGAFFGYNKPGNSTSLRYEQFCIIVERIVELYREFIQKSLHECAESNLARVELVDVVDGHPLPELHLPLTPQPKADGSSAHVTHICQSLMAFFEKRRVLLETQQIADDFEKVIGKLWHESRKISLHPKGLASLQAFKKLWRLTHNRDFPDAQQWERDFAAGLQRSCASLSLVIMENQHLMILPFEESPALPFKIQPGPAGKQPSLALHVQNWMQRYGTEPFLIKAKSYPAFIQTLYQLALKNLEGRRLHEELRLCAQLWESVYPKTSIERDFNGHFKNGPFPIPACQDHVMSQASSRFERLKKDRDIDLKACTKEEFEALYAALIQEGSTSHIPTLATVLKLASALQISSVRLSSFQHLLFHLRASPAQLAHVEEILDKAEALDPPIRKNGKKRGISGSRSGLRRQTLKSFRPGLKLR